MGNLGVVLEVDPWLNRGRSLSESDGCGSHDRTLGRPGCLDAMSLSDLN